LRISPVQQVANELSQELKVHNFGLQKSLCESQDLKLSMEGFNINLPPKWAEFIFVGLKGRNSLAKNECSFSNSALHSD